MGVKRQTNTNATKYVLNRKAGRSIIERRPLFSPDGESLALIVENIVRVYNIQTGDCVRTLETENVINELVAIEFLENEDYNLYGCSDTGCVTTWTWDKGAVLREANLQLPEEARVLTFNLVDNNECFITAMVPTNDYLYIASYSVRNGILNYIFDGTRPFYYDIVRVAMGWCNGDRYAAITNGTQVLFIQNLHQSHLRTQIVNHNKFRILSVAAHHRENTVAITDTLGRVTIITGNLYDYKNIAREVLHWHFLPPFASCFSISGSYLFTGGMEKVLVKWTLGQLAHRSNEKAFIPRLPGIIRFITANNSNIAITLSNNSVVIASAQMRIVSTILECGGISAASSSRSWLVYHRPLNALLLPGRTGHLQLYSTTSDKVLYNIDITEMNSLPSERRNLLPVETEVVCAAVSADGSWLVTSEYRNDGINYPEEKLKFWSAQTKNTSPFKLNTCVNLSHGGCNVVSLALSNKGEFCVSAGLDEKFRIWRREKTSQTHRKKTMWSCLTACYYSSGIAHFLANPVLNNFKTGDASLGRVEEFPYLKELDEEDIINRVFNIHKERSGVHPENSMYSKDSGDMAGVAISHDGSLIAAWFGCKLTLWDTHLCNLRTTLSHPALRPKGKYVMFGNNDAAHYVVCTTENCVAVWSLLSLTVKWLVQLRPTWLAGDPFSNKMAVVTDNNDVFIFRPQNSEPLLVRKNVVDTRTGVFTQCVFGDSHGDNVQLYLVRNNSDIYCLEPEQSTGHSLEVISRRNLPVSNFSALLAEQHLSDVHAAVPTETQQANIESLGNTAVTQFLSGAPHMIPPVSVLCTSFLQHLSGYEEPEEPQEDDDTQMEVDLQSSDDEDANTRNLNGIEAPKSTELWTPSYDNIKEKRLKKILKTPLLDLHTTRTLFEILLMNFKSVMELLSQNEIESIIEKCGVTFYESLKWTIGNYSSEIIGYLGEHLKLIIDIEFKGIHTKLNLFVKCIPRFNKWKAEYLRETTFFRKEYGMLNGLFQQFQSDEGVRKWRPKLLYVREELFVFEDISEMGYVMPNHTFTLDDEVLMATVEALARFHAQSYVYEESKTKELSRPYRIWEDYGEYLTEPIKGQRWRDTGKRAVIDYLKEYSVYKSKPGFCTDIEIVINMLFDHALNLMKPSKTYRNVVIHRDIWTNNIFLKKLDSGKSHALIVDFQTVLYSSPMLDLSSVLFFNTTKNFRSMQTNTVIELYYETLTEELKHSDIDVHTVMDKDILRRAYDDSIIFGITQAALIVPIIAMSGERRKEVYGNHKIAVKLDVISRSEEFIETARDDTNYRDRVTELLDDIVERFMYPLVTVKGINRIMNKVKVDNI